MKLYIDEYLKLRFASYSNEWESHKLGDILTFYSANSFSREKLNYESGNVKNIHYGDIHTKFPTILSISGNKDVPFINNDIDLSKYKDNQYLQEGDLIIADASEDYADIGKAIEVKDINDEKVLAGLHTILARDEKNITINGFKGYLFLTEDLKTNIKRIANGISVLGISKNNLSKLTVNIPNKNEQQKIVDFISSIDKKIELLEDKHTYYQDFKKYLMQQIFAQKLRFDNYNDDWKETKIKNIAEVVGGGTPKTEIDSYWNGDIKWYTPSEIGKTKYIKDSERNITEEGLKNSSAKLLPKNTILLSSRATVGEVSIALTECSTNQGFQSLITKNNVDTEFIYYLISNIKNEFLRRSSGSTFLEISKNEVKKIKINIPSLNEQKEIGKVLSNVDKKIFYLEDNINKTQEFKKGLLQQMFVYMHLILNFCAKICCIKYFLKS